MAKLLCICIDLTKFEENPEGLSFFCVDLTWNDPVLLHEYHYGTQVNTTQCSNAVEINGSVTVLVKIELKACISSR